MSAYIVDRNTIEILVEASGATGAMASAIGQTLWTANIKSVCALYPGESMEDLPGPIDCDFVYGIHEWTGADLKHSDAIKAANSYVYQSCDDLHWEESLAYIIVMGIRNANR